MPLVLKGQPDLSIRLPNVLSVLRIAIALPVLLCSRNLSRYGYIVTVCALAIAALSDFFDGYFARRWKLSSELGYILDAMGDRAIHLSLLLIFFLRYQIHPIFIWLLIFRDIGIYAVRVLSNDWLRRSLELRWISLFYASVLRLWLGLFIVRDGIIVFYGTDHLDTYYFRAIHLFLLCISISVSYYGLIKSFRWIDDDLFKKH